MAPLFTPDGRYLIVRGRLWRAVNPALDAARKAALTDELMAARREIARARRDADREAERIARATVHRAKTALGERGPVWWDDGAPDLNRRLARNTPYAEWYAREQRWESTILALLAERTRGRTICPSEVARAVEPDGWRAYMEEVRDAARALARQGRVVLRQKGSTLDPEKPFRGPIRIALAD